MTVQRDLNHIIDDLLADDPRRALIAYRRLRDFELSWIEQRIVTLARRDDWPWARIARLLGTSRQNITKRFGGTARLITRPDPDVAKHAFEADFARATRWRPELDNDEAVAW